MNLDELLDGAEVLSRRSSEASGASGAPPISSVAYDSRRVQKGSLFVAMRGEVTDGNQYIDKAIAVGAKAVVTDAASERVRENVEWITVSRARRALARISANFYGRPAERLRLLGITGTNGKTTTAFLLESMLQAAGKSSLLIGTIEYHVGGKVEAAPHTTPESLELNQLFSRGVDTGATHAVMEVSSHALAQDRVFSLPFDTAVFTNLTRDHLDYHGDMQAYFEAKALLFRGSGTAPPRCAVVNVDDDHGRQLQAIAKAGGSLPITYGLEAGDFHAEEVETTMRSTRFVLVSPIGKVAIYSKLIGRVNVYNLLAASAAAFAQDCSLAEIAAGAERLQHVPGRFQQVDEGQPFAVVVDYAHTDDALRNLTSLARELVGKGRGRVITLFGCGGDRDKTKRPLMGKAAGNGSDLVVLTSDNPRSEAPDAIIAQALVGLAETKTPYIVESDRRKAIALAIGEAHAGDIVLLAGKGHEKTQTTRAGVAPFDDVEVAHGVLAERGYDRPHSTIRSTA